MFRKLDEPWTRPAHRRVAANSVNVAEQASGDQYRETAEQLELLQDWECPDVQGFYFAEPMTAEAVAPLLSAGAICPTRPN